MNWTIPLQLAVGDQYWNPKICGAELASWNVDENARDAGMKTKWTGCRSTQYCRDQSHSHCLKLALLESISLTF
jgi:hypothetical protein